MSKDGLSNLSTEERTFAPSEEFAAQANGTAELYQQAEADREGFWAEQARRYVQWETDFDQVLDWSQAPFARWFAGGRLNACVNAVDRHVEAGHGDRVAIHWVGEPEDDTRDITYAQMHDLVQRAANALADLGVGEGDTVAIYLPMIPEAAVAMLACARLGAAHSVVFGGFSADALHSRIEDAGAKVVITADGGYRRGKP
jgi:acetyl-CoA synthetase